MRLLACSEIVGSNSTGGHGCLLSVLSRSLCDELITRPEESYRLRCVVVCDLETSGMRRPWSTGGCRAKNKTKKVVCHFPRFAKHLDRCVWIVVQCIEDNKRGLLTVLTEGVI